MLFSQVCYIHANKKIIDLNDYKRYKIFMYRQADKNVLDKIRQKLKVIDGIVIENGEFQAKGLETIIQNPKTRLKLFPKK